MKIPAGPSLKLMLVLGALFTLSPAAAAAQSVSGRLLDAESGQPIPTAAILLLRGDSIVRTTTTNGEGVFVVTAPEPGSYRIRSEHIAYQPATSESMAIGANERVILDLRLSVAAIALEAVTVVVPASCADFTIDRIEAPRGPSSRRSGSSDSRPHERATSWSSGGLCG